MKTSTVEVGELVSTLSAAGVHRQLSTLPGVHHADVNYVAGSATVHYDEAKITLDAIRQRVVDCGYHCRGELAPAHFCDPAGRTTAGHGHSGHAGHALPGGAVRKVGSADAKAKEPPPTGNDDRAGHGSHTAHAGPGASLRDHKADMMHDMGHAPGMSMQNMADDMRNRFLVALVFAVPIFLYSPMGEMFGNFPTPFGMNRKVFLFIVATAAIAYPV